MTVSPVPGVTLKTTTANSSHMRYAEIGPGEPGAPLVLFCHGWPESWYSWRHQLQAVSAAGFRCVAPDMRGYGGTQAPETIEHYTLFHLVGDVAELVKALGETRAFIVGHDWGAPVAWHAALWRPDLFPAVCAMMPDARAVTMPARKPPRLMAGNDRPPTRKPNAAPGSSAWARASPIRLMRRRIRNTPIDEPPTASARLATRARRMKPNSTNG